MTEVKELEQEYLSPQKRAAAILYNNADRQFSSNHDLTEYDKIVEDRYAGKGIMAETQPMQSYAEPISVSIPIQPAQPTIQPTTDNTVGTNFNTYHNPTAPVKWIPKAPEPAVQIASTPVEMTDRRADDETEDLACENVEYVVKFKTTTVIAVACITVVFLLLSILITINAVNIAKANVELNQLRNAELISNVELISARAEANLAKQNALQQIEDNLATDYTAIPVGNLPQNYDKYRESVNLESSTNIFDAICLFLSKIF